MATEKNQKKNLDGISRRENKISESFYSEVDKKNKNFISFWVGIIVFLIVIFSLIISIGLSAKRNLSTDKELARENSINLLSFAERMKDVRGDGRTILTFSRQEFVAATGADGDEFPLATVKFDFGNDKLRLSGRMKNSLVFWPIDINISHAVIGGKFKFLVAPDSFENIIVSSEVKNKIEETFDQNLNNVLAENQAKAEEIKFNSERIELHLIKKL
jgi:hypothetical protein